ncbi:hypothetical protein CI105_07170 [Candidatus Izimaplasma bacterium ZiA1]|uniref:hypothetical protein n=1 Tax=Candidatus Izimoplasma sp. ZiA1 TaxID=2024899 RepID=UPI000BAA52CE|nr:hypothetical protein CI105_07170 [Candidatus Izimaplasma bacterium ZiA1]
MNSLQIGITVFIFIEFLNICILYFQPLSKKGNGVGIFEDYVNLSENDDYKDFVGYLINWVAGAKLIFIFIGIVVVVFGNYNTQLFTVLALILSILSFYWKLYPTIKILDKKGKINPRGYYKTLNYMILTFILGFLTVFLVNIV